MVPTSTVHRQNADVPLAIQRQKPVEVPKVQCLGRTGDVPVPTRRQFSEKKQRKVLTIKRVQRTMSSTQVQHIDETVDLPVAM